MGADRGVARSRAHVPSILKRSIVAPYIDGMAFTHALRRENDWDSVDRGVARAARDDRAAASPGEVPSARSRPKPCRFRRLRRAARARRATATCSGNSRFAWCSRIGCRSKRRVRLRRAGPVITSRCSPMATGGRWRSPLRYDDEASANACVRSDGARRARRSRRASESLALGDGRSRSESSARRALLHASGICGDRSRSSANGRDLGVTLGPYTRDKAATRSAATCAMAAHLGARASPRIAERRASSNARK